MFWVFVPLVNIHVLTSSESGVDEHWVAVCRPVVRAAHQQQKHIPAASPAGGPLPQHLPASAQLRLRAVHYVTQKKKK